MKRDVEYRQKSYKETEEFNVGDRVLVFMPRKYKRISTKLLSGWSLPFRISKKMSFSIYQVTSEDWSKDRIILQRSVTFLKKFPNDVNFSYSGGENLNKQDFESLHDFEELVERDDEDQRDVYNLRHRTRDGNIILTESSGDNQRQISEELDDLREDNFGASSSDDEETTGFNPNIGETGTWLCRLPNNVTAKKK